jgi:hypothetical protein
MFLLYHSEGYEVYGTVFHRSHINDLRTAICSGMLGHRTGLPRKARMCILRVVDTAAVQPPSSLKGEVGAPPCALCFHLPLLPCLLAPLPLS